MVFTKKLFAIPHLGLLITRKYGKIHTKFLIDKSKIEYQMTKIKKRTTSSINASFLANTYFVNICIFTVVALCCAYYYYEISEISKKISSSNSLLNPTEDLSNTNSTIISMRDKIARLELEISSMKYLESTSSPHSQRYDLRDMFFLPRDTRDSDVLQVFMKKWGQEDIRYSRCGRAANRALEQDERAKNPCDIAIITSWFPRPCGIATHSGKLVEALQNACPSGSRIHVIAVRNSDEESLPLPNIVKTTILKERAADYIRAARYINANSYGTVLLSYEFGLYEHESILCMLAEIRSRVLVWLHTLADNLPWKYQALTEQVARLTKSSYCPPVVHVSA